jgi:hypothetical protein
MKDGRILESLQEGVTGTYTNRNEKHKDWPLSNRDGSGTRRIAFEESPSRSCGPLRKQRQEQTQPSVSAVADQQNRVAAPIPGQTNEEGEP